MNTVSMKLVSGEEIIARDAASEFVKNSSDYRVVSHARIIGLQQDRNGQVGIGLMDYVLSNKDCVISISKSSIIAEFSPSIEVERAYQSNVSNIVF